MLRLSNYTKVIAIGQTMQTPIKYTDRQTDGRTVAVGIPLRTTAAVVVLKSEKMIIKTRNGMTNVNFSIK
jgi:hypothetical protein